MVKGKLFCAAVTAAKGDLKWFCKIALERSFQNQGVVRDQACCHECQAGEPNLKTCQNSRYGLLRGLHRDRGLTHLQCSPFHIPAQLQRSSTSVTHFVVQKLAFTEISLAAASAGWSKRATMD